MDRFVCIPTYYSAILLSLVHFLFWRSLCFIVLCCYLKRLSFSLQGSFSLPCPSFLMWDFTCLLFEISIELFFVLFLLSGYFCSVDACFVCIVSGGCNQSSPAILIYSSSFCIDTAMLSWMQASLFPPSFLDTYSLSVSSLGCKALYIVISFRVLESICLSSSLVHFRNGPVYLT